MIEWAYPLSVAVLIAWDVADFGSTLKHLSFFRMGIFWAYVAIQSFFTLVIVAIVVNLNLVPALTQSFLLVGLIVPLGFVSILENIVVPFGSVEIVNVKDVFYKFRLAVEEQTKVQLAIKEKQEIFRIHDVLSELDYQTLRSEANSAFARKYGTDGPKEFARFEDDTLRGLSEDAKKPHLAQAIVSIMGTDAKIILQKHS